MSGYDLTKMIDELPAGLERALLRILNYHQGRSKAVSRAELVYKLKQMGFLVSERAMRAQINLLRKQGQPICSSGGIDGGYWMASGWDDLEEYIERELRPRAMDLLEQEKALRSAASERWGALSLQERMF